jgi:putative membrane protein
MSKTLLGASSFLACALALAGCSTTAQAPATAQVSQQDLDFVTTAYQLIEFDLAECRIVQRASMTQAVVAVSTKICADAAHYKPILQQQAAARNIALPNDLRYDLKAQLIQLNYVRDPNVDVAYLRDQIASHESALAIFMDEAKNGTDPALKATAAQTVPVVQDNLARLRAVMPGG